MKFETVKYWMLFPLGVDKMKMFAITTYIQHYIGGWSMYSRGKKEIKGTLFEN